MTESILKTAEGSSDIYFPGLGINLNNVPDGFTIFGLEIKLYGVIIALGFLLAYVLVAKEAKRTKQKDELYLDYLLWLIIPSILGARLYYIIFSWEDFFERGKSIKDTFIDLINIRNGGLAVYGGIIAGVIVTYIFAKKRKVNFLLMTDTIMFGLLIGQILGRWGNFFNREAFGGFTDSIFRMCVPIDYYSGNGSLFGLLGSGVINDEMIMNLVKVNGMECISVHPTFLYESIWNVLLLTGLYLYRKHKKFDGEIFLLYIWGYGMGRVLVEGLRSDSLMIPGTSLKVSQMLAAACVLVAAIIIIKKRFEIIRQNKNNK